MMRIDSTAFIDTTTIVISTIHRGEIEGIYIVNGYGRGGGRE